MTFGPLPNSFGQVIAAQPWLLGFYPGRDRFGWLAARNDEIVAVGTAQVERATTRAFAYVFTNELHHREFDTLLVTGAPGTLDRQEEFASFVATTGERVDLVEVEGNEYRAQGREEWRSIPAPPMSILLSGRSEPALSFDDLTDRYDLLPGPRSLELAPVLTHVEKVAFDRLRPQSRFARAMNEVEALKRPGSEVDPDSVARLGYLMTDPLVRAAVLRQVIPDRDAVAGLVAAHRVAHVDEGADLRSAAAMAVYTTSAIPTVADWVVAHAEDAPLSRQVRELIIKRVPSQVPRSMILGPGPMRALDAQDERWVSDHATPLPQTLTSLQERLQRLQGPIQGGPSLPPPGPNPPAQPGPQI